MTLENILPARVKRKVLSYLRQERYRYLDEENQNPAQNNVVANDNEDKNAMAFALSVVYAYAGFVIVVSNIAKLAQERPYINNWYFLNSVPYLLGSVAAYSNMLFVSKLSSSLNKISDILFHSNCRNLFSKVPLTLLCGSLGIVATIPSSVRMLTSRILPEVNGAAMGVITAGLLPVYGQDFPDFYEDYIRVPFTRAKQDGFCVFAQNQLSALCQNKKWAAGKAILLTLGGLYVTSYVKVAKRFPILKDIPSSVFMVARVPFVCKAVDNVIDAVKSPHPSHKSARFALDVVLVTANSIGTTSTYLANAPENNTKFDHAFMWTLAVATFIFAILHRLKNVLAPNLAHNVPAVIANNNLQQLNNLAPIIPAQVPSTAPRTKPGILASLIPECLRGT